MPKVKKEKQILGWREWVSLPGLGLNNIKAKVDTGAKTSALHATQIKFLSKGNKVQFVVYPSQDTSRGKKVVTAKLKDHRKVKSSIGVSTNRPVIVTDLKIGKETFPIEITLINRDVMGFRMLLGRQAIRKRYLVDSGASFKTTKNTKRKKPSR